MGVLFRRLILIKAFEMKNLLWTRLINYLTFQYIRRHKMYFYMMKSLCLFTAGFYFGDMLHDVFIDLLVALAPYALGH